MNKNIFKHNALVLILIFILGFVTMFSIKSIYRSRTIELLSNDMYKEDVVYCSQLEYISLNDMKTISNGLFVSKELGSNMRAIYFLLTIGTIYLLYGGDFLKIRILIKTIMPLL